MAILEITEVVIPHPEDGPLWGASIDIPQPGLRSETYTLVVAGWALDRASRPCVIDITCGDRLVVSGPATRPRRDVATAFEHVPGALTCGYEIPLRTLNLPAEFELRVVARMGELGRKELGAIRGRRSTLPKGPAGRLRPLLITTLGRTGSSYLALLLATHPAILVRPPFPYETRMSAYWMGVLETLSTPASYLQQVSATSALRYWWVGHPDNPDASELIANTDVHWLGGAGLDTLAAHCRAAMSGFYQHLARTRNREQAVYFAEKILPNPFDQAAMWELFSGTRELILVRDFRDLMCSVLAFNAKRGYADFNHDVSADNVSYVHSMRTSALALLDAWKRRSSQARLVRYEDLVLEPAQTLRGILEYLDLERTDEVIERMLGVAEKTQAEAQAAHRTAESAAASVGRWERDLPKPMKQACEAAFGDILKDFGYLA